MFGFASPISPQLQGMLQDSNTNLEDVLKEESVQRAFKARYDPLIKYLCDRSTEILDIALGSSPIAFNAFKLFTKDNEALVEAILQDTDNLKRCADLVFQGDIEPVALNRFAHITQLCALHNQQDAFENLPFIFNFLQYCNYRTVYEIFDAFLAKDDSGNSTIQGEMARNQFVQRLLDALHDLKVCEDPSCEDTIVALLRLVPLIVRVQCLADHVRTGEAIDIFTSDYAIVSRRILAEQWNAAYEVTDKNNISYLEPQFDKLVSFLSVDGPFLSHQVTAIRVLAKMAAEITSVRSKLTEANIAQKLLDVVSKFPTHTFAQRAVIEFTKTNVADLSFATPIVNALMQFASAQVCATRFVDLRAFCWKLYRKLLKNASPELKSLVEANVGIESQRRFEELSNIRDAEEQYGGKLPEETPGSEEGLANLTPDQIIALLRFLTNGSR